MKKILLDTNFLLIPLEFRVDIFSEIHRICNFNYKLHILDKTIDELKNITEKQKGKNRNAAKFGLKLIKLKNIMPIKTKEEMHTDRLILKTVNKSDYIVATQDQDLKRNLKLKHIPLITLRQKKYLILEGKI